MTVDIINEKPFPLAEATKLIPAGRNGKKCHLSTLIRWVEIGTPGPSGELVRLAALRLGGRWVTTRSAIQAFAEALTPKFSSKPTRRHRTINKRRQAAERAGKALEAAGI
jgi:hypothetical protein